MAGAAAKMDKVSDNKCFHFTVLDHRAVVIARVFLLLQIFDELTNMGVRNKASVGLSGLLYYTDVAPIMPKCIYKLLQREIQKAIDALEGRGSIPSFIDLPDNHRSDILQIFREWQHEAFEEFGTKRIREQAVGQVFSNAVSRKIDLGQELEIPPPKGCGKQAAFYFMSGILMLNSSDQDDFVKKELPELAKAYEQFDVSNPRNPTEEVLAAVDSTWATNVTMIDLDWEHKREEQEIDVGHSPFQLAMGLQEGGLVHTDSAGLYDRMQFWFHSIVFCLGLLKPRIKIEACIGDAACVFEQILIGSLGKRRKPILCAADATNTNETNAISKVAAEHSELNTPGLVEETQATYPDLADYPRTYDHIHLSNIPDYIGGSLTTFMYALPLLSSEKTSYVTANCLRNPNRWQSMAQFNNEYIGLSSPSDLEKAFHVRMTTKLSEENPYPLTEYQRWQRWTKSHDLADLLGRENLETWPYRLFLKLAIPAERPMRGRTGIYSPLNLSVFIKLCSQLHNMGYPAHWLSAVLSNIVSGSISTRARPPRTLPLMIREDKTDMPVLKHSTAPFVTETTTLISMYKTSLPFGIPMLQIPTIDHVRKYSYKLDEVPLFPVPEPNHFILVFFETYLVKPNTNDLRPYLLSDETGDHSVEAKRIRDKGLHILTTWTWNRAEKMVSFWLRQDVMQEMKKGRWAVSIWRTDNWDYQSLPCHISEVKDMGEHWAQR